MDLVEGIRNRRAIRKYKADPVSRDVLEKVFELAKWSPVAHSLKNWRYTVVDEPHKRDRIVNIVSKNTTYLRDLLDQTDEETKRKALEYYPDLGGAPVLVVISADGQATEWNLKYVGLSAGTEIMVLMLSAFAHGLGMCAFSMAPWVEQEVKKELELGECDVLLGLAIGYPDESPNAPKHVAAPREFA